MVCHPTADVCIWTLSVCTAKEQRFAQNSPLGADSSRDPAMVPVPRGMDLRARLSHLGKGASLLFNLGGRHAPEVPALHPIPFVKTPWLTQLPLELAHPAGLSFTHLNPQ